VDKFALVAALDGEQWLFGLVTAARALKTGGKMSAVFVHVSDIHFGQERDQRVHIHKDVKDQLIADAATEVRKLAPGVAHGILVTGDIAHAGKREQYEDAAQWLDGLAGRIGCPIHRVQMVPGNHDVDRSKLSFGGGKLLDHIRNGGAEEYEQIVGNPSDRATLYARFEDYGRFCIGYGCTLNDEARSATNLQVELAPGRSIRFIRMNSSLLCTGDEKEEEPELMIGERQFVSLPRDDGVENVVLIHHPLNWYKDKDRMSTYVRSRTRVFISGHEHHPHVSVDAVEDGTDLLMLAAGATVPFKSDEVYTFTYNILEFDWDATQDALVLTIYPRAWDPVGTRFVADDVRLDGRERRFVLGSPNFRAAPRPAAPNASHEAVTIEDTAAEPTFERVLAEAAADGEIQEMPVAMEGYDLALLRFFRDLLENERLRILVELDAIPDDLDEPMSQGLERRLFDWLARKGRLQEVVRLTEELIAGRDKGE